MYNENQIPNAALSNLKAGLDIVQKLLNLLNVPEFNEHIKTNFSRSCLCSNKGHIRFIEEWIKVLSNEDIQLPNKEKWIHEAKQYINFKNKIAMERYVEYHGEKHLLLSTENGMAIIAIGDYDNFGAGLTSVPLSDVKFL